jgi:hypothetical protein
VGGYDAELLANSTSFSWNNLIEVEYWTLRLSSVSVGNNSILVKNQKAVIDTGTSLIVVPEEDFVNFVALFS